MPEGLMTKVELLGVDYVQYYDVTNSKETFAS
jgi:hypothetical protein